ncbi:hypothetical protein, partial [Micrococcus luteus]|uniref:hypothetical protein n=1 Tax=Micrococcus luteus TaxID=1270 RepID=UPI001C92DFC1
EPRDEQVAGGVVRGEEDGGEGDVGGGGGEEGDVGVVAVERGDVVEVGVEDGERGSGGEGRRGWWVWGW